MKIGGATMSFQSEIRPSQTNQLLEKVASKNYGRYLRRLRLKSVRGFENEVVDFEFPVTALVGPNGSGKTTVLGGAACAYKSIKPQQFFAKSGRFDNSMQNWEIEFEHIDKEISPRDVVRRSAGFKNLKWRRATVPRDVLVFGVSRTVPANERRELRKCASTRFKVPAKQIEDIADPVKKAVGRILGKDISAYRRVRITEKGSVTLLSGATPKGEEYSEFHFGAGESSIIRMVIQMEAVPEQSLILIEEIENGLHPVATIRMVEYLIELAERRKIQAIFTTHSNAALRPLPSKAIWAATQGRLVQGKLDVYALRAITGQIEAQLAIFVEDEFSVSWLTAMLRHYQNVAIDHIEIHHLLGDGTAVKIHRNHLADPAASTPSACFIDGDSQQEESLEERIFRLPGQIPETYIYDSIIEKFESTGGRLTVALLQPYGRTEHVRDTLEQIRRTNRDPHVIYSQVGQKLGFIPERTVIDAFTSVWAEEFPDLVSRCLDPIADLLPQENKEKTLGTASVSFRDTPGLE